MRIINCVEKYLQTSYCALSFISFPFPLEAQLAHEADAVPPYNIMTQSSHPRKHMIAPGRCTAKTLTETTGERMCK